MYYLNLYKISGVWIIHMRKFISHYYFYFGSLNQRLTDHYIPEISIQLLLEL